VVDAFFKFSLLGLITSGYLALLGSGFLGLPTTLAAAAVHLLFLAGVAGILFVKSNLVYFLVKVIAFLELLAASVLSANLNFFLFLALFLLFGGATLSSNEIRRSAGRGGAVARGGMRRFSWRLAALTLVAAAGMLAMTAGLFFVLPRTARAAFQHLVPERYHLPGFSNQVVLGEIGQIKLSRTPVMRARIYGRDHEMPLKWRGAAMTQFDGRRWYNPPDAGQLLKVSQSVLRLADDRQRWRSGERINYEVQIKDVGVDALLFAGTPEFVTIPAPSIIRTRTDSFRLSYGSTEGLRYGAYSYLEGPFGSDSGPPAPPLAEQDRNELLLLPPLDPRIIRLARQVTAGLETGQQRASAIEAYLKRNYAYSMELPARAPADPLANFLFERRKGHCEYFASAMAVMLRVVWVPSRVVTGFQSGVFNPVTRWHLIRASDAHSWVEAFLPGAGWRTFDPTPPEPAPATPSLFTQFGLYIDAAETFWQEWVLNYNLDRQVVLAYRMEASGRRLSLWRMDGAAAWARRSRDAAGAWLAAYGWSLAAALGLALAVVLAGPPLWRWLRLRRRVSRLRRGEATAGDATLLYQRMLRLMRARGFEKSACVTPLEFLATLPPSPLAAEFTTAYNELRFGEQPAAAGRMMRLLEQMERA
jgi:transglutaminase-like putative cysteine protease